MKLAVIGSRTIKDAAFIERILDRYKGQLTAVVSGGAKGVDSIAEAWAKRNGIAKILFRPAYHVYGKRAPLIRNRQIVDEADKLIAFWDGESRGTAYTVKLAQDSNKLLAVYVTTPDGMIADMNYVYVEAER